MSRQAVAVDVAEANPAIVRAEGAVVAHQEEVLRQPVGPSRIPSGAVVEAYLRWTAARVEGMVLESADQIRPPVAVDVQQADAEVATERPRQVDEGEPGWKGERAGDVQPPVVIRLEVDRGRQAQAVHRAHQVLPSIAVEVGEPDPPVPEPSFAEVEEVLRRNGVLRHRVPAIVAGGPLLPPG